MKNEGNGGWVGLPTLILLMGPPGSGKSYLARQLATSLGATLVQSDTVRKQLFREPTYSGQESAVVFAEAHRLIEASLRGEMPTIFDATNLQERHRATLYGIAAACQAPAYLFGLKAPEGVAAARIAKREHARDAEDLSDATWSVYEHLAGTAEPPARSHVHLNATLPVGELVWLVQRIVVMNAHPPAPFQLGGFAPQAPPSDWGAR